MNTKDNNHSHFYQKAWFWVIMVLGAAAIVIVALVAPMLTASKIVTDAASTLVSQTQTQATDKKEYNIGEAINIDGVEYVVTSVNRNYNTGNQFVTPSSGKEFVKLNISLSNKSNEKKSYNAWYWKIEDENGDVTDFSMLGQADDALSSGELVSGGSKQASIVFEVPMNSPIKAHIQTNVFNSNDEAIVNL